MGRVGVGVVVAGKVIRVRLIATILLLAHPLLVVLVSLVLAVDCC